MHKRLGNAECGVRSADPTGSALRAPKSARLKELDLDALERFVARDFARQKLRQIRSAQPEDARARVGIGWREPRPIDVPLGRNRQPLVRPDAERAAVRE